MRLIDADALIEEIERIKCEGCDNWNGVRSKCRTCEIADAIDIVDDFANNHKISKDNMSTVESEDDESCQHQ